MTSLVIQQLTFGPPSTYSRPIAADPLLITASPGVNGDSLQPPDIYSSSFSRVSYNIPDGADEEDVKEALEGKKDDGIVGAMFGKGVKEQISSTWFWYVSLAFE